LRPLSYSDTPTTSYRDGVESWSVDCYNGFPAPFLVFQAPNTLPQRQQIIETKIQRLVDINREEEDYHLFNERQSRETVRQLRKSRKVRQRKKSKTA
jgi:hypothetical protein